MSLEAKASRAAADVMDRVAPDMVRSVIDGWDAAARNQPLRSLNGQLLRPRIA